VTLNELVVTEKVSFVKYFEAEGEMRFKTYLKAGGKYSIHAHDCNEYATVIKGHLIEMLNNKKFIMKANGNVFGKFSLNHLRD
jgi:quercetin dioxygenase-like cupin family protein